MIKECIARLVENQDLNCAETETVFREIMSGEATAAQIASFITALRCKGETVAEITGAVTVMRAFATRVSVDQPIILDTCGTGGDRMHSCNVSTLAALISASAGVIVAKHGNRGVSSTCGSADLLEKLGVKIDADVPTLERCLRDVGIAFLFAPQLHPAMKHAAGPRREMGIRTIFNILGPLSNPAGATHQVLGVFSPHLAPLLAEVLQRLGSRHVLVVHAENGMDEISLAAPTRVVELRDAAIREYTVRPEEFGFRPAPVEAVRVRDLEQAVAVARDVVRGAPGACTDLVVLNAGAALYAADHAGSIAEGISQARECLASGRTRILLERLIQVSHGLAAA